MLFSFALIFLAGLPCGKIVLSTAVLAILITAPLGAIGIDRTYSRLLLKTAAADNSTERGLTQQSL
ncbi:MAG: hypothetical protein IKQ90_06505 [Ruminococcus sp.]|nr:hypothetical protein [Ruminococcus sp.]